METILAAIDIGSNTLRLLIGSVENGGVRRIHAGRAITRLAEGVLQNGFLRPENMERSLRALADFAGTVARFGVSEVRAIGTSALREADNSGEFTNRALASSGIRIEVISGDREARLTALGVLSGLPSFSGPSLILDIGGGSTEWIMHDQGRPSHCTYGSVPLGVVNLLERFLLNDLPSAGEISALDKEVSSAFGPVLSGPAPQRLIGTGGTVTTLAAIDLGLNEYDPGRVHLHVMTVDRLRLIRGRLFALPHHERARIEGLEEGRADLIIPGILLTMKVLEILGLDRIIVSDYGILEGLLLEDRHHAGHHEKGL